MLSYAAPEDCIWSTMLVHILWHKVCSRRYSAYLHNQCWKRFCLNVNYMYCIEYIFTLYIITLFIILNKRNLKFKLSCLKCNKEHSMLNPSHFRRSHSHPCNHEGPPGQIRVPGTGWIIVNQNLFVLLMNYTSVWYVVFLFFACSPHYQHDWATGMLAISYLNFRQNIILTSYKQCCRLRRNTA